MAEQEFRLDAVDFDGVYEGKSLIAGADVSFAVAPWDIGEPQPAVVRLADAGEFRGEVLDAGSGLGENAIFLAGRGLRVTGVDGAHAAVSTARERAAEQGVEVVFTQSDVTTLDGLPQRFDTVLDSALYHCLDSAQRTSYAAALWRVTRPGARLHLLCFADVADRGLGLPMMVSQDDLREHLGGQWDIESIEQTDYTTSVTVGAFEGMGGARLRHLAMMIDPKNIRTDDQGRILAAMWQLRAARA